MNKPLSLILGLLAFTGTYVANGQDTAKKFQKPATAAPVKAATTKPATNPYKQPATYPQAPVATTPVPPAVVDNSLTGQYNAILKATYRYQQGPIVSFHKNYMDTLNVEKRKLKDAQSKLAEQAKKIAALQTDVTSKDQTLSESQSQVNSVSFIGISLSKAMYNIIMWGLVLVLGTGLVAVIYLSASSRREAAYRIKLFDELSAEFQTYKTKANEKEKKLARELQTERNKLDELSGK
ncbi:hypothetical protein [Mucilaginibacter paludis]|uniref:Uncharacterized protein n=1 Tax=Mucilaginibacter paludis DSM 18603 TaxID=714943 RepID=H1YFB4_9SPHI|nr:hypothetical protein [Mucilaginibacter paludis]EHQ26253.1 hypothetical protein Mucpa_2113 [Mucilaginibacter paludis DSM 18603]